MIKKFDYFLKNYRLYYQIDGINIDYGINNGAKVLISQSVNDSFFSKKLDIDPKDVVWKEWKGVRIPFCFDKRNKKEIITTSENQVIINYDIIGSAFYFLSGWNEYVSIHKDDFGRVAYNESIIDRLDISAVPVVNYYFDILNDAILKVGGKSKKALWNNKGFGVTLTHDIDTCKNAWLEGSFSELKKMHFLTIPKLIFQRIFTKDDWFNFQKIHAIENKFKVSSSFYFLPQKGKIENWKNADYNITDNDIKKVIKKLRGQGHEIGVHGSFGTHISADKLKIDIKKIESRVFGNRFHFLMFDPEKSVSVLEENNIKYDTTLGFAEQIGFRRATCYPFYLYNFLRDECSDVVEIPLITMDSTLQDRKYMGLSHNEAFNKIKPLIDEVAKFNGVFTILWHNTYFSDYKYTGWREVYIKILRYCDRKNGLLTNGKTIYNSIVRNGQKQV